MTGGKGKTAFVLKLLLSAGLLTYLITTANLPDLLAVMRRIHPGYYLLALATGWTAVVLSAFKWQVLLASERLQCRLPELVRYYLVGIYFNNFLPTSFGGDAARVYLLSRKYGQHTTPLLSVLAERISGLIGLFLFLFLGTLFGPRILDRQGFFAILLLGFVSLVFLCCGFHSRPRASLAKLVPAAVGERLKTLSEGLTLIFRKGGVQWSVTWTSVMFQILNVLIYVLVARSLFIPLSFLQMLAVVPLVTLLTMLPVSLNGLGIREGGFVLLLSEFQVPQAEALSLSFVFYSITLLLSMTGAICLLLSKNPKTL